MNYQSSTIAVRIVACIVGLIVLAIFAAIAGTK